MAVADTPALRVVPSVRLALGDVRKSFTTGKRTLEVLRGVSLEVLGGEAVAVTGPSGSGKSTLLHLIGTLDRPTSGTIELDGRAVHDLPEPELAAFRNRNVGFVFQDHHLLPQYTVLENVLLPTLAPGAESGMMTLNSAPTREQPSTIAAASRSGGMSWKKLAITSVHTGSDSTA